MALFPMVAAKEARSESSGILLKQSLFVTLGLCGAVAMAYAFLGDALIARLYGGRYQGGGRILGMYGFAMVPLAVVVVIKNYCIAKRIPSYAWALGAIAMMFVAGVWLSQPTSPSGMCAMVASAGAVLCTLGAVISTYRNTQRSRLRNAAP